MTDHGGDTRQSRTDESLAVTLVRFRTLVLVALAPIVVTAMDRAANRLFGLALIPVEIEAVMAAVTLASGAWLIALTRRWRALEADVRRQHADLMARLDAEAAQRLDALDRKARVRHVIEAGDRLHVVYQPVYNLDEHTIAGYEALARFDSGTPDGWFREAHELGMGVELEILAVRRAIDGFGPTYGRLGINVSAVTMAAPELYEVLAATTYPIVLELTEHEAVADYDHLVEVLRPLRDLGVKLAIDDAGAGFASFRHVLALEPDTIKLDRSLIADVGADTTKTNLVRSLHDFARSTGVRLLAEGIETEAELAVCKELGIEAGQGYLLGRPGSLPSQLGEPHTTSQLREHQ